MIGYELAPFIQIGLKFQLWPFENGENKYRAGSKFSGPLHGLRGHKVDGQYLKIVDFLKVAQKS